MNRVISVYSGKSNQLRIKIIEKLIKSLENSQYNYIKNIPNVLFCGIKDSTLGQYDVENNLILLNSKLINYDFEIIFNVALHELAHYITINHVSSPHDELFKEVCTNLGAKDGFENAKINITKQEKLIDKISKLQALAASPFTEEGMSALLKISELTAKYNINESCDEDEIYMVKLYEAKKISTKQNLLARIVKELTGVVIIKDHMEGNIKLLAFGSFEELQVADYLYDILYYKIEKEIEKLKKSNPNHYKGVSVANGFYLGVLNSIKLKQKQQKDGAEISKALVLRCEDNNLKATKLYYSQYKNVRSYKVKSNAKFNSSSYNQGNEYGSNLEIERGLSSGKSKLLLE